MKTKHTPGPWKQYGLAVRAGNRNVCSNVNAAKSGLNITEQVDAASANARLIAAAPDLLGALQSIEMRLDAYSDADRDMPTDSVFVCREVARAAIRKALGEEK